MRIAVITLSREGVRIARRLEQGLEGAEIHAHAAIADESGMAPFRSIRELTDRLFPACDGLIFIAPCGVAVRSIAPFLRHKTTDPAVVVVDAGGRYAISLLSGHEGGANDLAFRTANLIEAEPVVSTTTEAVKNLIVGVGCRRGADRATIAEAVREGLRMAGAQLNDVRVLASADIKMHERGLREAAVDLGLSLRFVSSNEIRSTTRAFGRSSFVEARVKLPAVAEPSALLAGRRTQLVLHKCIINGVTVAIARERSL